MMLLLALLLILVLVLLLACCYADVLFFAQDLSTWRASQSYLADTLSHPGGWLEWCGGWLTQFFYYPALGAGLLGLLWLAATYVWIRALRLQGPWQLLALSPIVLLYGSLISLGYWLFCLTVPNHWFAPSLAYLLLGLAAWGYSRCAGWSRSVFLAFWLLLGIPLLGWYATLGLGVMLLLTPWRQGMRSWLGILGAVAAASFVVVWYYNDSSAIHWKESLPVYGFPWVSDGVRVSEALSHPVLYAALCILLLPCLTLLQPRLRRIWQAWVCGLLPLALMITYVYGLPCRDAAYYAELQMLRQLDRGEFKAALQVMSAYEGQPTREMVMMKDAALAQLGQLADHAFDYDIRGIRPTDPHGLPVHIGHSAGPIIYYWLGLPNYAYMWCCDNDIEHGYSPLWLRVLYRCCMANGEERMAEQYRRQLDGMLFNAHPEVSQQELARVRRFMTGANDLANDEGLCEPFLLLRLSTQDYDTPEGQQIALHYAMLMRQPDRFYHALDRYVEMVGPSRPLPRYVGEAHLAFSHGQHPRYQQYQQAVMQRARRRLPLEKAGEQLYPDWGHTFWWYFDFSTNQDFY